VFGVAVLFAPNSHAAVSETGQVFKCKLNSWSIIYKHWTVLQTTVTYISVQWQLSDYFT